MTTRRKQTEQDILSMTTAIVCVVDGTATKDLRRCLRSVFGSGVHSVAVVDGGRNGDSVLQDLMDLPWKRAAYHPVDIVGTDRFSRGRLWNWGAFRVRSEFLLFTDADVVFTPKTMTSVVKQIVDRKTALVFPSTFFMDHKSSDRVRSDPDMVPSVDRLSPDKTIPDSDGPVMGPDSAFMCDRYSFYSSGGFDGDLFDHMVEGLDLVNRWERQGRPVWTNPNPVFHMYHSPRSGTVSTRNFPGEGDIHFVTKNVKERSEPVVIVKRKVVKGNANVVVKTPVFHTTRKDGKSVVILSETLGVGGAEKMTVDIANALSSDGRFGVTVVLTVTDRGIFENSMSDKVRVVVADDIDRVVETIKNEDPFAVLVNNSRMGTFHIRRIKEECSVPYVTTLIHGFSEWAIRLLPPEIEGVMDEVMTISGHARNGILKRRPFWKDRIVVVENYTDTDLFTMKKKSRTILDRFGWNEDDPVFGYMGRISGEKSLVTMVDIFSRILKDEPNGRLLIVGGVDDSVESFRDYYREQLKTLIQYVKQKGVQDRVGITGMVADPWNYLPTIDVFMMTSTIEGTPLALLEAMACGISAVCSPVGTIPQILGNGFGYTVGRSDGREMGSEDRDEFARRVVQVFRDKDRKIVGKKARRYIERHHSIGRFRSDVVNHFESVWKKFTNSVEKATG